MRYRIIYTFRWEYVLRPKSPINDVSRANIKGCGSILEMMAREIKARSDPIPFDFLSVRKCLGLRLMTTHEKYMLYRDIS